jgi:hypothetical protein
MRPRIDGTEFGSITIDGSDIEPDVLTVFQVRLRSERRSYPRQCSVLPIQFHSKRLGKYSKRGLNSLSLAQAKMAW